MREGAAARPTVLVVCIGNALLADDAFGPAVYERLSSISSPDRLRLVLLGVGGIRLLDELHGEDALIVVDAMRLGAPPGSLHVLEWDRLPEANGLPVTAHDVGIREAIAVGRLLDPERVPRLVTLIGAEGRCFDTVGAPMTREVAAAVETAVEKVLAWVAASSEKPAERPGVPMTQGGHGS